MVSLFKRLLRKMPTLRHKILVAHLPYSAERFLRRAMLISLLFSSLIFILGFFTFSLLDINLLWLIPLFIVVLVGMFFLFLKTIDVQIRKRQREIDEDVLFLGRFLLVKIDAGQPFFNALIDASKSRGITSGYIRDVVQDVELGTPIEQALEKGIDLSPSDKLRRILFQINNALKTGIDIGESLRRILDDIASEQIVEIKEYGKKLNSIAMFYMLFGVIVPSLGITLFIVISSFTNISLPFKFLLVFAGVIVFIQYFFISLFKSIRPAVGL